MRADELTELVERARAAEVPPRRPPADLLEQARQARHRRRRGVLVAVVVAALVATSAVSLVLGRTHPPAPALPYPGETRLVGAAGFVVEVPATWRTEVGDGEFCAPTMPRTVKLYLPSNGPVGSCAVPTGGSWPAEDSLAVYTAPTMKPPRRPPAGTVGGLAYYLLDARQTGPGSARELVIPDAGVWFIVGASTTAQADALLGTIRPVPDGDTTVDPARHGSLGEPGVSGEGLDVRVVEVHRKDDAGRLAGYLIRTDPPLGTAVPRGTTVTVELSAGDLGWWVTPDALAAQQWTVTDPGSFDPPVSRSQAFAAVSQHAVSGTGGHDVFLRDLDGRLVWLVAIYDAHLPALFTLNAVDAATGDVIARQQFPRASR